MFVLLSAARALPRAITRLFSLTGRILVTSVEVADQLAQLRDKPGLLLCIPGMIITELVAISRCDGDSTRVRLGFPLHLDTLRDS